MKKIKSLISFIAIVLSIVSCADENDCSRTGRPFLNCKIYKLNPSNDITEEYELDSITVIDLETKTTLINNQKKVKSILLPLRYVGEQTTYVFQYQPTTNPKDADTIVISHKNNPQFQSSECGFAMQQTITSSNLLRSTIANGKENIESIKLIFNEANNYDRTNMEILYRFR